MSVTESLTRVADAQALWTHQFRGQTVVDALTSALVTESQTIETVAQEILTAWDLEAATGDNLDELGLLVGQLREGRNDARYRIWIQARIRANRSSGSPVDMYAVSRLIFGDAATLWLRQQPVGHVLQVDEYFDPTIYNPWDVQRILQQTSSVAVPFQYWYAPYHSEVFTFASGSSVVPASSVGFDGGRLRGAVSPGDLEPDLLRDTFGADILEILDWTTVAAAGEVTTFSGNNWLTLDPASGVDGPDAVLDVAKEEHPELTWAGTDSLEANGPSDGADTVGEAFEGTNPYCVAWIGKRGDAAGNCTALEIADDISATEIVRFGVLSTDEFYLYLDNGASTTFTGPSVNDTDYHTWIVSYDGAGDVDFWVDGVKTSVSGTHRSTTGLEFVEVGKGSATSDEWGAMTGEMIMISRTINDAEAETLHTHLERSYTDVYS